MADRVIGLGNTLNEFRTELNGTAADVGDIADVLSASSFIASSTDLIEAIVAISPEIPEITTDAFIFPGRVMAFEGATDDAFETTLTFTEPTGDRTHTMPDHLVDRHLKMKTICQVILLHQLLHNKVLKHM